MLNSNENMNHDSTEYAGYVLLLQILRLMQQKYFFVILTEDVSLCWNSKVRQNVSKLPSKQNNIL